MILRDNPAAIFYAAGMKPTATARFRRPTVDEQEILIHLVVAPIPADEVDRFDRLLAEHHYLKDARLVGEHLRYVASYRGQWVALAAWSAAALHIKPRDQFIGWTEEQRRRRLPLVVNNSRLLVLAQRAVPQSHQPFHEADAGEALGGLATKLGPSGGAGRNVCRSASLSRHRVQSQRLESARSDRRLETQRRGFLPEARTAQANLGARTAAPCLPQTLRSVLGGGVESGGGKSLAALHGQSPADAQPSRTP